jgi:ADP-ribose pyrophosphatase YjhB (NUDIX family)
LTLEHPGAIETVHRFEADSKFFRSLLVVLCILIPWGLVVGRLEIVIACLPLLGLAFWRYVDQRLKGINQAYWYIITLEAQREGGYQKSVLTPSVENMSHAGGVVFRQKGDQPVKYLLITAKNSPQEWILPKGHIELGEEAKVTAVREVREETGHWARIIALVEDVRLGSTDDAPVARFFLMECVEEGSDSEDREQKWLPIMEAVGQATFPETRSLLEKAEQLTEEWVKLKEKQKKTRKK